MFLGLNHILARFRPPVDGGILVISAWVLRMIRSLLYNIPSLLGALGSPWIGFVGSGCQALGLVDRDLNKTEKEFKKYSHP